ncbi:MAG: hypothetical protein RLY86_3369, partial [Pseudomonadota bacterium]
MALSFRNKLTLFLVLTLVTVQVLTAVMVMGFTRSALIDQGKEELASATALFARQLDVRAAQLAEGVQILALDFPLRQAIATRDTATALSAMRNHGRRIGATRMLLVGLDGQVVVENDERAGDAPAMTGAFPFASLLETAAVDGIASSLVVLGGRAYWLVTVPVLAPVPIAFVAAGIPLDDALVADLQTLSALPRSIALLTEGADGRWTIAARTEAAPSDPIHLVAGGTTMAEGVNLVEREGTERLVLRQPLEVPPGSPHVLAVLEFSLAEALDPYRPILGALTLLLIGGLVAALFGTLLIARSITRPVEALSAVARRIAKGDYTPPPPLPQKDELGQLADALGTMAHAIGEREEKIRHQASHDVVTGLFNRTALADRIDGAIAIQAGQGTAGALLLVGLERLQEIVNTLGHAVGDRL